MNDPGQKVRICNKLLKLWQLIPDDTLGNILEFRVIGVAPNRLTDERIEENLNTALAVRGHPE